jgi:hypothetical protein
VREERGARGLYLKLGWRVPGVRMVELPRNIYLRMPGFASINSGRFCFFASAYFRQKWRDPHKHNGKLNCSGTQRHRLYPSYWFSMPPQAQPADFGEISFEPLAILIDASTFLNLHQLSLTPPPQQCVGQPPIRVTKISAWV